MGVGESILMEVLVFFILWNWIIVVDELEVWFICFYSMFKVYDIISKVSKCKGLDWSIIVEDWIEGFFDLVVE